MICAELKKLADLYLTTVGEWTVSEKWLIEAIAKSNPRLAECFAIASAENARASERTTAFEEIVDVILRPYGGPLRYFETKRPRWSSLIISD